MEPTMTRNSDQLVIGAERPLWDDSGQLPPGALKDIPSEFLQWLRDHAELPARAYTDVVDELAVRAVQERR
jgi:hypothetical protein